jgi:hypothetical protein
MSTLRVNEIGARTGSVVSMASGSRMYLPGSVIQVGYASLGATFSVATAGDLVYPITNLAVTLTPSSASSIFLIFVNLYASSSASGYHVKYRINRNGVYPILGNPEGGRPTATGMINPYNAGNSDWQYNVSQLSGVHMDSPNTLSPITYRVDASTYAGTTLFINRAAGIWQNVPASGYDAVPVSTLTVMEIAQ